jgi:hypothetical protein
MKLQRLVWGALESTVVLSFLAGCAVLGDAPTPTRVATPTPTTAPTFTPDPCTGWWCTVTGVVYAESTDSGNELEGVTVTLYQTSYCSPTSGQQQTETGPDGGFEFSDVFFHDTDRIRIQFESEGYESARWDSTGLYCLYCSCFGPSLEIVLYVAPDP